jgi:hypothetical protein
LLITALFASAGLAEPITFAFQGIGSGTLTATGSMAVEPFVNSPFTFSFTTDTAQIKPNGAAFNPPRTLGGRRHDSSGDLYHPSQLADVSRAVRLHFGSNQDCVDFGYTHGYLGAFVDAGMVVSEPDGGIRAGPPKRRRVHQSTQIGFGSLIELGLSRGQGLPPLDEAEHCLLDAGVATLRWYSGSSWNAIHPGLAFGFVGIPAV